MSLFRQLASAAAGTAVPLNDALAALKFDDKGLVAAIAQDATSQQVLMMAWMDAEALKRTLTDGYLWYYSRSRQTYWKKGETSGHVQKLVELRFDCDGDAVLALVEQTGVACHTMRPSCFYLRVDGNDLRITSDPE